MTRFSFRRWIGPASARLGGKMALLLAFILMAAGGAFASPPASFQNGVSEDAGRFIAANAAFRTRILGTTPVHPDGSFNIEVPADVPQRFELLDEVGRMLVHEIEFNSVRRGETKGCIGCHENRRAAAPNLRPPALDQPPVPTLRQLGDLIYMGQKARLYNRVYRD
jgi:hypothetical protein